MNLISDDKLSSVHNHTMMTINSTHDCRWKKVTFSEAIRQIDLSRILKCRF